MPTINIAKKLPHIKHELVHAQLSKRLKHTERILNGFIIWGWLLRPKYVMGRKDTSQISNLPTFYSLPLGSPRIRLRWIKPVNKKLHNLIPYPTIRVMIMTDQHSSRDISGIQVQISNLHLKFKYQVFNWNDLIKHFAFLTCFLNDADMLNIAEEQAVLISQFSSLIRSRLSFVPKWIVLPSLNYGLGEGHAVSTANIRNHGIHSWISQRSW